MNELQHVCEVLYDAQSDQIIIRTPSGDEQRMNCNGHLLEVRDLCLLLEYDGYDLVVPRSDRQPLQRKAWEKW